jgi:hypothetical protein
MAKLAQDFGIAEDAIMEDYWIFITDLEKEGLIVVDE